MLIYLREELSPGNHHVFLQFRSQICKIFLLILVSTIFCKVTWLATHIASSFRFVLTILWFWTIAIVELGCLVDFDLPSLTMFAFWFRLCLSSM